ncbi:hypothetical protein BGW38_006037 [Lunasporangiospora selenospora]|uniref:Uncharacterized protein n=1 Tax=Lunasporangiospora selenospora TaxID=979761 RepID=A0A9P6KB63_9FUNG|nr:hypothetical protein BGW38_006037 [Lunasporangiospora selenospora]
MLRATRPMARALAASNSRASLTRPINQVRSAHSSIHNRNDPAIPADATGFLPGDKITGDTQIGDYPNLPMYNQQWRSGFESAGYWDRQDRRNYGETVPEEDDVLNIWSPDVWAFPTALGVKRLLTAAAAFIGFGYFVAETRAQPHFERRTYPYDGLVDALGVDSSDEVMVAKRAARSD